MIHEIKQIPEKAEKIYYSTRNIALPLYVPYLGMGSSFFATLALYYQGIPIQPFTASEYYQYLSGKKVKDIAVLISQSGRSSEVLWCRELFRKFYVITNELKSPLCVTTKLERVFPLLAGKEEYSSTKTYMNTLITLYNGLKIDPYGAVNILQDKMDIYEKWGMETAEQIYDMIVKDRYKGAYIIGNGPNIATASQAGLILSESTKYPFIGMSAPEYDHGHKETAKDSVVIVIKTEGSVTKRTNKLFEIVENAGAKVFYVEEKDVEERLSPITAIIPINFMAYYLARLLKISKPFAVGNKVTEVEK